MLDDLLLSMIHYEKFDPEIVIKELYEYNTKIVKIETNDMKDLRKEYEGFNDVEYVDDDYQVGNDYYEDDHYEDDQYDNYGYEDDNDFYMSNLRKNPKSKTLKKKPGVKVGGK
eukprot:TRINITY_DN340_c0_g1_i2.p4 TRINITY_DN340_c0_g1~~TRINITY_DN340_c0_g1_i2.p4  ORF type:complete len:113 (+),score=41.90 TRINITY_DN340_c0_g1_i2:641-979(+)